MPSVLIHGTCLYMPRKGGNVDKVSEKYNKTFAWIVGLTAFANTLNIPKIRTPKIFLNSLVLQCSYKK